MILYSLENLNLREINALRKSLDYIPITGIDAMFIGTLQMKLNEEIKQIEEHLINEQEEKNKSLQKAIKQDLKPSLKKTTPTS